MYTAHFGLRDAPFRATPDPRFFYSNPGYREAYATLQYGVLERKGFVALTGEVGTGKTTLLRRLMDQLGPPVRFVLLYNTTLTFDETVEFICAELDLTVEGVSRVQQLQRLNDLLIAEARRGGIVVLLIDEAQNLSPDVLENLRLMSNLETSTEKLLQIVLVGQPELDAKLADPALRQVAQRIAVRYCLQPLRREEVQHFIDYRLRRCGRTQLDLFTAGAVKRVTAYSNGVPRLINILCDGALLAAFGAGMTRVTGGLVDEVAAYLRLPRRAGRAPAGPIPAAPAASAPRWIAAGLATLVVAGAAAALLAGSSFTAVLGDISSLVPAGHGGTAARVAERPAIAPSALLSATVEEPAAETNDRGDSPPALDGVPRSDVSSVSNSADAGEGEWALVSAGSSVSTIVARRYGRHHVLGLDLVQDLNGHIVDLNRVAAGERLWMPALTPRTLARRQPDGSYQLIVDSLVTPEAAQRVAERVRLGRFRTRVATRLITAEQRVHRVVIEGLEDVGAVDRAWRTAQTRGWTPTVNASVR